MTLRGVQATGTTTMTSTPLGLLRTDARSRSEFLALTPWVKSCPHKRRTWKSGSIRPVGVGRIVRRGRVHPRDHRGRWTRGPRHRHRRGGSSLRLWPSYWSSPTGNSPPTGNSRPVRGLPGHRAA
jgi:hypothetical protein